MKTSDKILLAKIRSEALMIADMVQGHGRDSFISDEVLKRAVCMAFINIGERIKHLSDDVRLANKHIPWKSIAGTRDVVAHGYDTLRMADI